MGYIIWYIQKPSVRGDGVFLQGKGSTTYGWVVGLVGNDQRFERVSVMEASIRTTLRYKVAR